MSKIVQHTEEDLSKLERNCKRGKCNALRSPTEESYENFITKE